jgi:hydroxyethylthiazole kinase-like uncharacterized protein yjeF
MAATGEVTTPAGFGVGVARAWLRTPSPDDHKVSRGVLGARTGSARYPGAAVLGVSAAWRTGIGMIRYVPPLSDVPSALGLPSPAAAVLSARPETLFGAGPCAAWLLGSGTEMADRSSEEGETLRRLHTAETPLVVDAGALETSLIRVGAFSVGASPLAPAVLTPHRGEFLRLWTAAGLGPLADNFGADAALRLAAHLSATILLKGSTSLIASPEGHLISVGPATPWLATAGTGDVLAGILGALVASHATEVQDDPELLAALAATAALVHDAAARIASHDTSNSPVACVGAPITAFDVVDAIPTAIQRLRSA